CRIGPGIGVSPGRQLDLECAACVPPGGPSPVSLLTAGASGVPLPRLRSACFLAALAVLLSSARAAEPATGGGLTLVDGDRVVLLGSTFIERAQAHGYLESALTSRFPGVNVKFRNLGWS